MLLPFLLSPKLKWRKVGAMVGALGVAAGTAYGVDRLLKPTHQAAQIVASGSAAAAMAPTVKPLNGDPVLDKASEEFFLQTATINHAHECFPLHMRDTQSIGILYLYCSEQAYQQDGEPVRITDNFSVPSGLARRYNFWRRVYSLWTKDQYVMHLSVWPEVVIETYDASRMGDQYGAVARELRVKKVAKLQRDHYKRLFNLMHKHRKEPERFTPAMRRLAAAMAHIPNDNKYWIAARTLRLQRGQRDFIAKGLAVAPKYLPYIQQNFEEQGVPKELSLIAFVESSFNLKAHSKVGASGVYQIMPSTGRQYLKQYPGIDERNDPIKASRAAAKLFALNYKLLGHWPLAVTAYNHGVGGVKRAVRSTGSTDLTRIIDNYHGRAFKFASKNFYASFLGVLATLRDADRLFPEVERPEPLRFTQVRLATATSIKTLGRTHGVTPQDLEELNPDINRSIIRRGGILPRGYVIKLPPNETSQTEAANLKPVELVPNT